VSSRLGRCSALLIALLAAMAAWCGAAGAADEFEKYGLEGVAASLSSNQAGEHADLTITFKLTRDEASVPYASTRDIQIALPPGVIGNPQKIGRCTVQQLGNSPQASDCPLNSQVGVSEVRVTSTLVGTFTEPVYNMVPPTNSDIVARFGLIAASYPTLINVRVNPVDYSLVASVEGASSGAGLVEAATTLWGVPADSSHNEQRITPSEALSGNSPKGGRAIEEPPVPFLSNPTDCSLQRQLTVTARSYQLPDRPSTMSAPFPEIGGCGKLSFEPRFTVLPTNTEASAPTGLDAELVIPQSETPQGRATANLKSARVTLPEGMTINPSAGDGLEGCSAQQVGYGENRPSACPDAAKIGSAEMIVPALEKPLHGSVYQRTPEPGHLFRFWLVTDEQGVYLKLPAEIEANALTGQLTTVFAGIPTLGGNPQVPFESLELHIFGGPRAPLSTPASCGTYQTHFSFAPWSGRPPAEGDTPMQITSGCNKGGFAPKLAAGSLNPLGGHFTPFTFTLTRQDGEANPQTIAVHLPQGLLAKLGGVPLCPDAAAVTGACPASSRIGSLSAAAGVGGAPLWIPQPGKTPTAAYLAGPYRGGPFSIVSVVPAQAGPFDLGLVVNRAAIYIDPETALATIKTDPLPQILEGVPVSYRTIHVNVDREHFMLNPTSCAEKKISATVLASNGASAEPSDGFQATSCGRLAYTPKLKLSFKGSTKRTGNPAVRAVLTQKPNQANTKAAVVILPRSEFIDSTHISNPCTRVQFDAGNCPKASILGHATARTPLLDKPLKGPVYFRSNGGDRELPDIVADLHGAIRVTLVGYIDSVRSGPESSRVRTRFLHVPDAPVTKFTMSLFGGKRGLIENSDNLCRTPRRAELKLRAQNGKSRNTNLPINLGCGKKKR
jgi:hypothetical protein